MEPSWRYYLKGAIIGVATATLAWWAWTIVAHLYLDHQRVDQIWQLELNRAAAAQAAQPK